MKNNKHASMRGMHDRRPTWCEEHQVHHPVPEGDSLEFYRICNEYHLHASEGWLEVERERLLQRQLNKEKHQNFIKEELARRAAAKEQAAENS